ncbi:hypothetical protein Fmac_027391 [Flemingia macrophylla]|uniref:Uncharacterized protein n=1 Tax=Flemingia macrophylla TaxID=520843 RepID=A0ABD1LHQ6_9FABA
MAFSPSIKGAKSRDYTGTTTSRHSLECSAGSFLMANLVVIFLLNTTTDMGLTTSFDVSVNIGKPTTKLTISYENLNARV